jgi:WD40 repeat protein/tetratricopeptide (TPR) repeat protein
MGVVYKARQVGLNRVVALKMILAGDAAGPEQARFRTEAESAARLQHPNIVQVFEVGEHNGLPFFSQEFCGGGSLDRKLKGTPLPPAEAAKMVETLAGAMQAAHRHQVIHRDLKPANVLLTADGTPKIADFGLAKKLDDVGQTKAGTVVGTPSYMPPEQALGQAHELGPAADIYSLGAILYELLTGRPPFKAATTMATLRQVLNDDPVPPRRLQPQVPGDLETICLKCLHKEPAKRYATAEEVAQDLHRFLAGEPIVARPASAAERLVKWVKRHPGVAAMVALVVVVTLVGLALVTWKWREAVDQRREALEQRGRAEAARAEEEVQRRQAEAAEKKEKAARREAEALARENHERLIRSYVTQGVRLMDDGDLLGSLPWFASALKVDAGDPERAKVHRTRLAAVTRHCPGLLLTLFPDREVQYAEFSPDDRHVATAALDAARVWDATTGAPVGPVLHQPGVRRAYFSPDGRTLVTASVPAEGSDTSEVQFWEVPSGKPVRKPLKIRGRIELAAFNPRGDRLLTAVSSADGAEIRGEARVWDAATLQPLSPPLKHGHRIAHACFSPEGQRVLTASWDGTAQIWDTATGQAGPALRPKAAVSHASFSADGRRVVTAAGLSAQIWDASSGQRFGPALYHGSLVTWASFSPNGQALVTASWDKTAQVWEVATGARFGLPLRHDDQVRRAEFSPDGRRILTVGADQTARVWDTFTGKSASAPLRHNGSVNHASFSHDGKRVLTASDDETVRIWDLDPERQRTTPKLEASGDWLRTLAISKDGQRVLGKNAVLRPEYPALLACAPQAAFPANLPWGALSITKAQASPPEELYQTARVWDLTTGKPLSPLLPHPAPVEYGLFSPDGRYAVTVSLPHSGKVSLWLWEADTGRLVAPPLEHPGSVQEVAFSPDGKLLVTAGGAAARGKGEARVWEVATGRQVISPLEHQTVIYSASFSADSRRLATVATHDRTGAVQVWDVSTGRPTVSFPEFGSFPLFITVRAAFSRDGKRLAVATIDKPGTAAVLDLATGEPVGPPVKHDNWVWQVALNSDGLRLLTVSRDRTARVWDVATGEARTPPLRHRDDVLDAAFSPDDRFVVTGAADGTARVWDATTGLPVSPPLEHASFGSVNRVAFSPDGKRVFTEVSNQPAEWFFGHGATPRSVWVWDLSTDDRPAPEAALLAEWLAGRRLDATGSFLPLSWRDALDHLSVLVAAQPDQWPLHYRRGRANAQNRRWERAIADYTRAVELGAQDADVYLYRAKAHTERKEWAETAADASKALELGANELVTLTQRAVAFIRLGRYEQAIADYTRLLERHPDRRGSWSARGFAYAALGRWDRAEADYAKAHEVGTAPSFEYQRVLLRLAVNDLPGYRNACAGLLKWGGPNPNPDAAQWIAWACVLLPDAGADPARLVQLAERAALDAPKNRDSLLVRGAALCRASKWAEAVAVLNDALAASRSAQVPAESSERSSPQAFDGTNYEMLYLAIAHHHLGHAAEARQWLDKGTRWMEEARLPKTENGADNPNYHWARRVAHEVLRAEAERLLQTAKP